MPGKEAKISLRADISAFSKDVDEAKRLLSGIGDAPGGAAGATWKFNPLMSLIGQIKVQTDEISKNIRAMAEGFGFVDKAITKAFDPEKINRFDRAVKRSMGGGGGGGGGGEGGSPRRGRTLSTDPYMRLLGVGAGGMVLFSLMRGAIQEAVETRTLRGLTGIGGIEPVEGAGKYGFAPTERRSRALEIAQAFGSRMTGGGLEERITRSEMIERGFGVSGGVQAGVLGAGRRAGLQRDLTPQLVSQAIAAGMTGSRMTEYLESMTNSLESLSEGVNIDDRSLVGLSGLLISNADFFKQDARRVARTMGGLNEMFAGGDRFQQAQAFRGIRGAAGSGATVAGIEIRRQLGLFANLSKDNMDFFSGGQAAFGAGPVSQFGRTLGTSGIDILQNVLKEIERNTKNLGMPQQAFEFMSRIGMMNEAGLTLFRLSKQDRLTEKTLADALKESPETIKATADKAMTELPAKLEALGATIKAALEEAGRAIADPATKFTSMIENFEKIMDEFNKERYVTRIIEAIETMARSSEAFVDVVNRIDSAIKIIKKFFGIDDPLVAAQSGYGSLSPDAYERLQESKGLKNIGTRRPKSDIDVYGSVPTSADPHGLEIIGRYIRDAVNDYTGATANEEIEQKRIKAITDNTRATDENTRMFNPSLGIPPRSQNPSAGR